MKTLEKLLALKDLEIHQLKEVVKSQKIARLDGDVTTDVERNIDDEIDAQEMPFECTLCDFRTKHRKGKSLQVVL